MSTKMSSLGDLFSFEQPTEPGDTDVWNSAISAAISAAIEIVSKDSQSSRRRGQFFRRHVCEELINKISCLKR